MKMILQYFTLVHVLVSLVGIASGFGMLAGLMASKLSPRWTDVFLVSTAATSLTGFFFPFRGFTPAIALGIVSLIALAAAAYALHLRRLSGGWRRVFVLSSIGALYLNFLVLIVQLFQKFPAFAVLAPKQSEPAFVITQITVLIAFVVLTFSALRRFK